MTRPPRPGPAALLCMALALGPGVLLLMAVGLGPGATPAGGADPDAHADDARVFTASDLVADPFILDCRAAEYSFWAWTDGATRWVEAPDQPPDCLVFRAEGGEAGRPDWVRLARRPGGPDGHLLVSFGRAPGRAVPALLAVSADPDFDPGPALDLVRGDTKSVAPPPDARRAAIRTEERGIEFDPPGSLAAWQLEADAHRDRLRVDLGLWPEPPRTDLRPAVVGTADRPDLKVAVDRVVLETRPGVFLAGNVYRPTGAPGRRPGVLCPHGHAADGRFDRDVQARCVHLARMGCVVFSYDMVGYGDGKPFGHAWGDDRTRRWGLSLAGLQTWNSLRALDYLSARPDVDPGRLGVTGESGGATQTLLLTALDPRVKVAAPVVMVADGYQGGCACENAPGLRWDLDNVAVAALAAPRPLIVIGATGDWTARTITNAYPTLQLVYGRFGASDRVAARVFDFPHNYNRTSRAAMYPFFDRWLLGHPEGTPTLAEDPVLDRSEPADALRAYAQGTPYPAQALDPKALADRAVRTLAEQIGRLAPGDDPTAWGAARARLATAHRIRVPVDPPSPRETVAKLVRTVERPEFRAQHFVAGRVGERNLVPLVLFEPREVGSDAPAGALTVVATERGKVDLVDAHGEPSPLVAALLDRGQAVVGFDPLLVGESADPARPGAARPGATHFLTYNYPLAVDRIRDLAVAVSWARSRAGVAEVHLVAQGRAGALALLARPGLEGLGRTVVDLGPFALDDGATIPPALDLPGVFQFGGLPGASALASPAPLWIAGTSFDPTWARRAYELAGSPGTLRLDRNPTPDSIARWVATGEK